MHVILNNISFYDMLWRRYKISMFRKLLLVCAVVLLAAVFILPAGAQFCPFGGIGPFGIGTLGTSYSTGFTTASTFSSGFTTVNGVAVPFGTPFLGAGISPFGFGCGGLGFGGFGPFC